MEGHMLDQAGERIAGSVGAVFLLRSKDEPVNPGNFSQLSAEGMYHSKNVRPPERIGLRRSATFGRANKELSGRAACGFVRRNRGPAGLCDACRAQRDGKKRSPGGGG